MGRKDHMPDPVAFTTERRIAVLAAGFGMLISLVLFGISLFRWSISSELGLWFLFLLCLFHFIFFYRTSTTKRQVKAIDYPYLVIGGLAIYLAFADSERTRTQYISTLDEITAPSTTAGLQSFIHSAMDRFCFVNGLYVPANFCHWSNQIAQFLSHEYSRE
jgi:hypothetical protein